MKSPKFRKTIRIAKALVLILMQFATKNIIFAQTLPIDQNPITAPDTKAPKKTALNNRINNVDRTPINAPENIRDVQLGKEDIANMATEEKNRLRECKTEHYLECLVKIALREEARPTPDLVVASPISGANQVSRRNNVWFFVKQSVT